MNAEQGIFQSSKTGASAYGRLTLTGWPKPAKCRRSGLLAFTLIEMIGVLAIVAALAVVLLPNMIKHMDVAAWAQEVANLNAMHDALSLAVLRNTTVPDNTGWAQAAATWSGLPVSQVATNARRYNRIYFTQSSAIPSPLPFVQTAAGTSKPSNLRAILLSTLGGPPLNTGNCPNPSGGALADADFNLLWNTPDGAPPSSGLWANWTGGRDDFLVQRIDYASLFHHLVLVNRDSNYLATFTINGSSAIAVTNGLLIGGFAWNSPWDSYYRMARN